MINDYKMHVFEHRKSTLLKNNGGGGGKLVSDIFKSLQDQPNQEIEIEGFYDHNAVYQKFPQEYCQNKCIHKCMYPNHSMADFIHTYLHSERHGISHDLGFLPVPLDHTEL